MWSPVSFVPGVHGGAPPDRFFPGGQDWGFHPLHPQRIREDGYRFFSAALARAFRHAACLRIDHVMGLQRLFMIPEGAGEGAYVSYAAEELHALVALEAHRAGTVVVGEDLGHGARRCPACAWRGTACCAPGCSSSSRARTAPAARTAGPSLAALGTHDLPRFAAYLWGDDVTERAADRLMTGPRRQPSRRPAPAWRQAAPPYAGRDRESGR